MKLESVKIENPKNLNFILGQTHFIKTVEDIYELMVTSVPGAKFGLAFCEASGPCLIRKSGTDRDLIRLAVVNAERIACGHTFFLFMTNMYPINILPRLKQIAEVVNIFCATANPTQAIVARTKQGSAVLGVVDGGSPQGVENKQQENDRKKLLRKIGYKL